MRLLPMQKNIIQRIKDDPIVYWRFVHAEIYTLRMSASQWSNYYRRKGVYMKKLEQRFGKEIDKLYYYIDYRPRIVDDIINCLLIDTIFDHEKMDKKKPVIKHTVKFNSEKTYDAALEFFTNNGWSVTWTSRLGDNSIMLIEKPNINYRELLSKPTGRQKGTNKLYS